MHKNVYACVEQAEKIADASEQLGSMTLDQLPSYIHSLLSLQPDMDGNVAFFASAMAQFAVDVNDSFFSLLAQYSFEDEIIYLVPSSLTKQFFTVTLSEEIYARDEDEVREQLERLSESEQYLEVLEELERVVTEAQPLADGSYFTKSLLLSKHMHDVYSVYWHQRVSCCGHLCRGCIIYYFPPYAFRAIHRFFQEASF